MLFGKSGPPALAISKKVLDENALEGGAVNPAYGELLPAVEDKLSTRERLTKKLL